MLARSPALAYRWGMSNPLFDAWTGLDKMPADVAFKSPAFKPWGDPAAPAADLPVKVEFRRVPFTFDSVAFEAELRSVDALVVLRRQWLARCSVLLGEGIAAAGLDRDAVLDGQLPSVSVVQTDGSIAVLVDGVQIALLPPDPLAVVRARVDAQILEGCGLTATGARCAR